jgi:hypothetical protein
MAVIPDKGKMYFVERNVDIPGITRPSSAYDLGLYAELGASDRAVLICTVIANLTYKDGDNLAWTGVEKTKFTADLKSTLISVWQEKHTLQTTTPTILPYKKISVIFDLQFSEGLSATAHSHWNITITKIPPADFKTSSVSDGNLAGILNGRATFDSNDLQATDKGGTEKQYPAAHEFGHILGYKDEYLNAKGKPEDNASWTTDLVSIMNCGSTVQARHYIWFADWCNRQCATIGALSKQPIDWKVDGTVNLATALV